MAAQHGALLTALADPTRRAIFERLGAGPRSVSDVAAGLPVSRPAVSQHLAVLRQAGLVADERVGRTHLYRLEPRGLEPLRAYVDGLWAGVLDAYREAATAEAGTERSTGDDD